MFAAFTKLPIYGKALKVSDIPDGALHKIEFSDLEMISVNDFVWRTSREDLYCVQVKSIGLRDNQSTPETVSYEMMCQFPSGSMRNTFKMGQETNLFYIDPFFLYRHFNVSKQTPSAEIVRLKHKRGGS